MGSLTTLFPNQIPVHLVGFANLNTTHVLTQTEAGTWTYGCYISALYLNCMVPLSGPNRKEVPRDYKKKSSKSL